MAEEVLRVIEAQLSLGVLQEKKGKNLYISMMNMFDIAVVSRYVTSARAASVT